MVNARREGLVGRGLTDHPTSNELTALATNIGNVTLGPRDHAKIIFYSRGLRDSSNKIRYPFNVEMNINHEYWHLRENDPEATKLSVPSVAARIDIKFNFGNCLDENNEVKSAPPFGYVPEIVFRNQSRVDYLAVPRFPAVAGWHNSTQQIWDVLNHVMHQIFSQFQINGQPVRPSEGGRYGQEGKVLVGVQCIMQSAA